MIASLLATISAVLGWAPSGPPPVVLAECGIISPLGTVGTLGDSLIVFADDEKQGYGLWITNGTRRGTRLLKRIPSVTGYSGGTTAGDAVYFTTDHHGKVGPQLWRTDGTVSGTRLLHTFGGDSGNYNVGPRDLVVLGDSLSFTAWDEEHGGERWRSDGTPEGTTILKDIRPGPDGSKQLAWGWPATRIGHTLYFGADDGEHGLELWRSDGTPEGTQLVKDITPGPERTSLSPAMAAGEVFYFLIWDEQDRAQLWRSDGTVQGTNLVPPNLDAGYEPGAFVVVGDALFFEAHDGANAAAIWRTDAATDGAQPLPGPDWTHGATLEGMTVVGDKLLFTTREADDGYRLWRTDDTAKSATYLTDMPRGSWGRNRAVIGDTVYFAADDGEHGKELWRTDGTPEGTALVKDVRPGAKPSSPSGLTALGDVLYFGARDGEHGHELWRSDGTADGTRLVKDIRPGPNDWSIGGASVEPVPTVSGELAYLISADSCTDYALWRSDGTKRGTFKLLATR